MVCGQKREIRIICGRIQSLSGGGKRSCYSEHVMANAQIIIGFLKVILTGPVVGGAIALAFIVIFREQLNGLVARLATIRFPGGELSAPQLPGTPATTPANPSDIPPHDRPTRNGIGPPIRRLLVPGSLSPENVHEDAEMAK